MHSGDLDDLVMCLGDFNGHVDGFDGDYGVGQRNLEGRILLEFRLEKELCVSNTWFKKEERRKVTFSIGENETEIDCVLIRKNTEFLLKMQGQSLGSFNML